MSATVGLTLSVASLILAVTFLMVLIFSLKNGSRGITALKVLLCVLLVGVNIPRAIGGDPWGWLLVNLWGLTLLLNLASLAI